MKNFFMFDGETFELFETIEEAEQEARGALQCYREEAHEGWPEATDQICYGKLSGHVVETERRPIEEDEVGFGEFSDVVDYDLSELE